MCGIFGCLSNNDNIALLMLKGLKRLEYRGYDSCGMAFLDNHVINVKKDVGEIDRVNDKVNFLELKGHLGIAHTRWSTTGKVTKQNSHPHQSCDGNISIVHNGIIENYEEIKQVLTVIGHKFVSNTDSEVIAHYFEEKLKNKSINEACIDFIKEIKGTFAILLLKQDEDKIYALKRDSPLAVGICKDKNILASDIHAFSNLTNKAIFFDNDEFGIITKDSYELFNKDGKAIEKLIKSFEWKEEETGKKKYKHFMMKEIEEEPKVVDRLLRSLDYEQKNDFGKLIELIKKSKKIIFAACGTSYHASLLGAYYLHKIGVEVQTLIASEFKHYANVDKDTLVIAISQSGETMDVIDALNYAKEKNAKIVSLVNVPYSTIQRMSELSLNILAGQEISVASTKAFVNQTVLLLRIAQEFGYGVNLKNLSAKLKNLFQQKEKIRKIAKKISQSNDAYIIGRGLTYPVAREIALKIKEISYIHAEGMMGGELKHGTLALIDDGTPVISLISNSDEDIISNTREVEARGADITIITNNPNFKEKKNAIYVNTGNDGKFGLLAATAGQLLAYHIADVLGRPIDKPKNLSKSISVR
ncbi:MAG: glutamine--fructose-6-phosphate transaminase (isomerizing) [Nanoarchaeota archaeon]|nr:glutamine--fructose-6-phosphate transaminase (isomerizing) [Nanoarchaeota archaeon]